MALAGSLACDHEVAWAQILDVDEAEDICALTADPCVIDEPVIVVDGAVLDFGARRVQITGEGRLDTGVGAVQLLCGGLSTNVGPVAAIEARGPGIRGALGGGLFTLIARRACSGDEALLCTSDDECRLGTCANGACEDDSTRSCTVDAECSAGTCSLGDGNVTLNGRVRAHGDFSGVVRITAAGDITAFQLLDAHATSPRSDGGSIEVRSHGGSVTLSGPLDARSGRLARGGSVAVAGAGDVSIRDSIDVHGGGLGGGSIAVSATRDVFISAPLSASATSSGGDAGSIALFAERDLSLFGDAIISASGDAVGGGGSGDGGSVELEAGRDFMIGSTTSVTTDSGGLGASGGTNLLRSGGKLTVAGSVTAAASGNPPTGSRNDIDGCSVEVFTGGVVEALGAHGSNTITARKSLEIAFFSNVTADPTSGSNTIIIPLGSAGPIFRGEISPRAELIVDRSLSLCSLCGDGVLDAGETCDDGNRQSGDGCSNACRIEGCIAQTPGWPETALCDDGVACTDDVCGEDDSCRHEPIATGCSDGEPCTDDICDPVFDCRFEAVDGACDDGLACTTGDICVDGTCVGTPDCPSGTVCDAATGACAGQSASTTTTTTTSASTTTTASTPPRATCGNLVVEPGEECDVGPDPWSVGGACRDCQRIGCGDVNGTGSISAVDALFVLRAAVGLVECAPCVCNVDGSTGDTTTTHALSVLRLSTGAAGSTECPSCP